MNIPGVNVENIGDKYSSVSAVSLALPILGIIASVLIIIIVIWPKINETLDLQKENKQLEVRADNLEKKVEVLKTLDKKRLEQQVVAAEQLLPSEEETFSFLFQVENSAALSGVLLDSIDVAVGSVSAGQGVRRTTTISTQLAASEPFVSINLSLTSDYQSLLQFLSSLYAFTRVVSIDGLSVGAAQGDASQLRTSFTVSAFWKSLPSTLGSIESPIQKLTGVEEELLANVDSPEAIQAPTVPQVPLGRPNLFTPF